MLYLIGSAIGLVSYLIGSIPTGYLVGKARGVDIRQHGSGNIGATNVFRTLGKKLGVFVFVCDALKGLVCVRLALHAVHVLNAAHAVNAGQEVAGFPLSIAAILGGTFCILGHNYTCWLRFKGGKGIATSAGVLVGMLPLASLGLVIVWTVAFYASGYVSLASILAAAALPVLVLGMLLSGMLQGWPYFFFALLVGSIAVWRHRSNIQRLMNGTEHSFRKKKP